MKHELKRLYRGQGIMREIKPSCSCGWVGIGYEAHNDYQHTLVQDQERKHLHAASKVTCSGGSASGEQT